MRKVGVGVIGAGNIGFFHLRGLQMVNVYGDYQADLVVLADCDEEAANRLGKRYGFKKITTNWEDVINDPEVEVVSVLTPNCEHAKMAIAAAKAGKHVMVEKPMAMSVEEAKEMEDAFAAAGVSNMVNFIYRTVPVNVEAKKLVEEGALGDITFFRGWFECSYKADPETKLQWRDLKSKANTGVIGDIIAHIISISDFVGGSKLGEIVEVCANTDTYYKTRKDLDNDGAVYEVDTDDICSVLVKYSSGRSGIMYSSRIAHGHDNYFGYEIECTKGTLSFDLERMNELTLFEAGDKEVNGFMRQVGTPKYGEYSTFNVYGGSCIGYPDLFAMHYEKLFKAIDAKKTDIDINISYGAKVDRIMAAIVKSAEEGRWVKVSEM